LVSTSTTPIYGDKKKGDFDTDLLFFIARLMNRFTMPSRTGFILTSVSGDSHPASAYAMSLWIFVLIELKYLSAVMNLSILSSLLSQRAFTARYLKTTEYECEYQRTFNDRHKPKRDQMLKDTFVLSLEHNSKPVSFILSFHITQLRCLKTSHPSLLKGKNQQQDLTSLVLSDRVTSAPLAFVHWLFLHDRDSHSVLRSSCLS
jgi:hypothetical protein